MRRIRVIALISAVIVALILGFYVISLNNRVQNSQVEYRDVVVVTKEIPANSIITRDMVTIKSVPTDGIGANAVSSVDDVVGKMALSTMFPEEIVINERLIVKGEGDSASYGLAYIVKDGMRGMSIMVEKAPGVSSLLKIGNYVDVIFSDEVEITLVGVGKDGEDVNKSQSFATTLLQNIKIVSLESVIVGGSDSNSPAAEYDNVTLELTPEQAQKLAYAISTGSVWLTLRPQGDNAIVDINEVIIDDIVDKAKIVESIVVQKVQ